MINPTSIDGHPFWVDEVPARDLLLVVENLTGNEHYRCKVEVLENGTFRTATLEDLSPVQKWQALGQLVAEREDAGMWFADDITDIGRLAIDLLS